MNEQSIFEKQEPCSIHKNYLSFTHYYTYYLLNHIQLPSWSSSYHLLSDFIHSSQFTSLSIDEITSFSLLPTIQANSFNNQNTCCIDIPISLSTYPTVIQTSSSLSFSPSTFLSLSSFLQAFFSLCLSSSSLSTLQPFLTLLLQQPSSHLSSSLLLSSLTTLLLYEASASLNPHRIGNFLTQAFQVSQAQEVQRFILQILSDLHCYLVFYILYSYSYSSLIS